ncbi:MAG: metallophosphoesterase [Anaerolineales bacterium]
MTKLTLLHLSDLHFSSTKPDAKDAEIVRQALLNDLALQREQGINPDAVIFSGDLIFSGDDGYSQTQNDYDLLLGQFLKPLLDIFELSTDHLFICPGNHDVQRKAVNKYHDLGLKKGLINRQAVNEFIDNVDANEIAFNRLSNFDRFKKAVDSKFKKGGGSNFFSSYVMEKEGKNIGIACVNSVWMAYGGKDDYGELLIGERTVDDCIVNLSDCDFRIGIVHHPFEYLKEFERTNLERRVLGAFHLWLRGHTHEPNIQLVQQLGESETLIVNGGALYNSREYHNGYSIIRFCFDDNSCDVQLREYIDRKREFAKSLAYGIEGTVSFKMLKLAPLNQSSSLVARFRNNVIETINKTALSRISDSSRAPKELFNIFVEPRLFTISERQAKSSVGREDPKQCVALGELLLDGKNILFIGGKESGKTSLLHYINVAYLETNQADRPRIPLFVDCAQIPQGKDRIIKALHNYIVEYSLDLDLEKNLTDGNCVLLFDDLPLNVTKIVSVVTEFVRRFPKNRYIYTTSEMVAGDIGVVRKKNNLGVDYIDVYIHSFGKKQIVDLSNKWFHGEPPDELSNMIIRNIAEMHLPGTPMVVSLMLLIVEQRIENGQQISFAPINKAALLEQIIEILLEKILVSSKGYLDYRSKEHFLSFMAHRLAMTGKQKWLRYELVNEAIRYFESKGLRVSTEGVIDQFIASGILTEDGGFVSFRFSCFREFFVAKYMIESKTFQEFCLTNDEYLKYISEIDYLTGLQRNNQELLELLLKRAKKAQDEFDTQHAFVFDWDHFDNIQLPEMLIDVLPDEQSTQERTEVIPMPQDMEIEVTISDDEFAKLKTDDTMVAFMQNLLLLSNVIKNCELIDSRELKRNAVEQCMTYYLRMVLFAESADGRRIEKMNDEELLRNLKNFNSKSEDITLPGGDRSAWRKDTIKQVLCYAEMLEYEIFESLAFHLIGTSKLGLVFDEIIEDERQPFPLRIWCAMVSGDLALPGWMDKFEIVAKDAFHHNKHYHLTMLYHKLLYLYGHRRINASEQQMLENLVADIYLGKKRQMKSALINTIRRQYRYGN